MSETGSVTMSLWPATPLPLSVARELRRVGIDVRCLPERDTTVELTHAGQVGLRLELHDCEDGLGDVEALLATLRLARLNYMAWDSQGRGRRFDAGGGLDEPFAVPVSPAPPFAGRISSKTVIAICDDDDFGPPADFPGDLLGVVDPAMSRGVMGEVEF